MQQHTISLSCTILLPDLFLSFLLLLADEVLSVESCEGREQQGYYHPVELDIDSACNTQWEKFDEGGEQNDGGQCFEVVIGQP